MRDVLSARVTRPVQLLKGFQRITLAPGELRTVNFTLGREQLQYLGADMQLVVEPGTFELLVGGSSAAVQRITLEVLASA